MSTGYFILASILAIGVVVLVRMILTHWLDYRAQRREMLNRQTDLYGRTIALLPTDNPVKRILDFSRNLSHASIEYISGMNGYLEEQLEITRENRSKKEELREQIFEYDLYSRQLISQLEAAGVEPAWRPPPLPDWITLGVRPITHPPGAEEPLDPTAPLKNPPPGGGANPAEGGNDLAADNP